MKIDPLFFGRIISEAENQGMTRAEIAATLGLKPNSVSQIKHGVALPGDDRLDGFSALIDRKLSIQDLLAVKTAIYNQRELGLDPEFVVKACKRAGQYSDAA